MQIQPYLFFQGCCEEALNFYRAALGAEIVMLMRMKDSPDQTMRMPNVGDEKILHSSFRIGATELMASDGECTGTASFQGFSLALNVKDEAEAQRTFTALSDGGQVRMPLTKTFWSPSFGMVVDRFGVAWMVSVPGDL